MRKRRGRRIGLALGGGSARGLAHLGAIRALEEAGVEVALVAGTSMGALVGAVFASGRSDGLAETFLGFDWRSTASYFDVVFPTSGLIGGEKVNRLVRSLVGEGGIGELPLPFAAVATDVKTGEEVVLTEGDVVGAVRASISVPGIFTPVRRKGRILVDGGLVNPLPVSVARALGADTVIAVDVNHELVTGKGKKRPTPPAREAAALPIPSRMGGYLQAMREARLRFLPQKRPAPAAAKGQFGPQSLPGIFELMLSSVNIMETRITESRLAVDPPDLLIRPPLGGYRFLDFDRAQEIIAIGYETAKREIKKLG